MSHPSDTSTVGVCVAYLDGKPLSAYLQVSPNDDLGTACSPGEAAGAPSRNDVM